TIAFAAGALPTVTRPPIEAVRGRLSRCGVCALAMVKTTRGVIERRIENRVNRNISSSLRVAEKRARIARRLSLNVLCQNRRRFETPMTAGIVRVASRRRKRMWRQPDREEGGAR